MNRTVSALVLVAVLTAALAALGLALQLKGYGFGNLGVERLDGLANAATFIPLAAIYAFAAALIMIAPIRPAGFLHANGATPIFSTSLVLLATIIGVQLTRFAFGNDSAIRVLFDWQFVFAAGIIVAHQFLDEFRRNALTRTLAFAGFLAATLACLFWTFRF